MKKHVINYDNKIKTYILIYVAAMIVSSLISIVMYATNFNGMIASTAFPSFSFVGFPFTIMMVVGTAFAAIIVYTYYMSVSFKCVLNSDHMRYGTLGLRKLYYKDIESIEFDKHILIKHIGKKSKIRVLNFEENIDKYQELIEDLKENSSQEFNVDEAMAKLSYINNFEFAEEGKSLRLNGWLFVLFVASIIFTSLLGLYMLPTFFIAMFSMHWSGALIFLVVGAIFALSLILTIMIGKRSKKVPGFIRILIIIYTTLFVISIIIFLVSGLFVRQYSPFMMQSMSYMGPSYVFMLAGYAAFALMIFRALKISKRIKYTFVYDKGERVLNYDKSVDPGFKLFAWEPASIYGVLSWIIMPVTYILLYILMLVSIFIGAAAMY